MWILFDHAERLGTGSALFFFRPEQPLRYTAGQFVELQIPHQPMDARGALRWFTLTSQPGEEFLSIAATFPEPGSSYKQALRRLQTGTRLHVSDPLGDFVLPKDPSVPMVWMAGGIGAASFVGMAKELAFAAERRRVTLFQSARQSDDLVFENYWQLANLDVRQTVTGRGTDWHGHTGRFSASDLLHAAPHRDRILFYISGSETMVESISNALVFQEVQPQQIVREAFTGY